MTKTIAHWLCRERFYTARDGSRWGFTYLDQALVAGPFVALVIAMVIAGVFGGTGG